MLFVKSTFFGLLHFHRFPDFVAQGLHGFLGGQGLQDHNHLGHVGGG